MPSQRASSLWGVIHHGFQSNNQTRVKLIDGRCNADCNPDRQVLRILLDPLWIPSFSLGANSLRVDLASANLLRTCSV
jgi:hypothetical protein